MRPARIEAVVLIVAVLASSSAVRAQDGAGARELFERGYAALMEGRFPEARDLLRESLSRQARPATAFNLVLALLGTEQPVAATEVCARLLGGDYGALTRRHRAAAERECKRAEQDTGTLVVEVRGAPPGQQPTVRVDGAPPAGERRPDGTLAMRVEPGTHVVSAAGADDRRVDKRVTVTRGDTTHLALQLPPDLGVAGDGEGGGPSLLAIGVGAGAAAAAVITVVLVTTLGGSGGESEPFRDPVFGVTAALR